MDGCFKCLELIIYYFEIFVIVSLDGFIVEEDK